MKCPVAALVSEGVKVPHFRDSMAAFLNGRSVENVAKEIGTTVALGVSEMTRGFRKLPPSSRKSGFPGSGEETCLQTSQ